jgi:hypothetical protein
MFWPREVLMTKYLGLGTLTALITAALINATMMSSAFAKDMKIRDELNINERVQVLEAKVEHHEKALSDKLNECRLEYKKLGRRATWCPEGSVVTDVEKVYGTEILNVSCARPILICDKLGMQIEL